MSVFFWSELNHFAQVEGETWGSAHYSAANFKIAGDENKATKKLA